MIVQVGSSGTAKYEISRSTTGTWSRPRSRWLDQDAHFREQANRDTRERFRTRNHNGLPSSSARRRQATHPNGPRSLSVSPDALVYEAPDPPATSTCSSHFFVSGVSTTEGRIPVCTRPRLRRCMMHDRNFPKNLLQGRVHDNLNMHWQQSRLGGEIGMVTNISCYLLKLQIVLVLGWVGRKRQAPGFPPDICCDADTLPPGLPPK
jgi:hypothetical protein